MNICSYLVHVRPGRLPAVVDALNDLPGCEAVPADNGDMAILVTETEDKSGDRDLGRKLELIRDIECVALAFGAREPDPEPVP